MKDALGSVQSLLVLGGTSEIGLATASALAHRGGLRVVLAGRDEAALKAAAERLAAIEGTTVEIAPFDATDTAGHEAFVTDVFERAGDVDVVLFAFGVLGEQLTDEHDAERAVGVITSNFVGAVSVGIPVADHLAAQGHGTIVVLSSVAAERPRRDNFVYGSSKAGLDAFAQGLGDALVGSGVRVVIVRPGFVRSKMTTGLDPAPFATTPEAVADAIADALASGKEVVWVPAVLRWVAMVFRFLPRSVWRRVSANR